MLIVDCFCVVVIFVVKIVVVKNVVVRNVVVGFIIDILFMKLF